MRIIVPSNNQYAEDFIQWLIKKLQSRILLTLDLKKIYPLNKYQKDKKIFKAHSDKSPDIDFHDVLRKGISSITYRQVKDNWIIYIPENISYKGYFTTLYALCRFVDKGNYDISGYSILSKNFNHVAANISKYYNLFLKMFVL